MSDCGRREFVELKTDKFPKFRGAALQISCVSPFLKGNEEEKLRGSWKWRTAPQNTQGHQQLLEREQSSP